VIQESDKPEPDDNVGGGLMCFNFQSPTTVLSIGVMDIASNRGDFLEVEEAGGVPPTRINFDGLGSNSVQTVDVHQKETVAFCFFLFGEGALTQINLCASEDTTEAILTSAPASLAPVTDAPFTAAPNDGSPTTVAPATTASDTTIGPTTLSPVTTAPVTLTPVAAGVTFVPSGSIFPSDSPNSLGSMLPSDQPSVTVPLASINDGKASSVPSGSIFPSASPSVDEESLTANEEMPSDSLGSNATSKCLSRVFLDFETTGNGVMLERGAYVSDEWLEKYGLSISASSDVGGFTPNNTARIFDTAQPFTNESGDLDLGSPHM
jgi:hypothetical protein